ncbi:MAG: prepilin-type N-terminal cleavage/methylation domain-containing protein [Geminicoccaceae bacterium]
MSRAGRTEAGGSQAGFTLIELMVAMLLLGMLTAVVYPSIAALGRRNLDDTAAALVAHLRGVRHEALESGLPQEVASDDLASIVPAAVRIEGFEDGPLVILPNGASSGAELVLRQDGEERHILVDWLTGRIGLADG